MLPKMRDRVIAMVVMLVMSATMMVSVSYAWITLSLSPEVSGLATTIAGNGSLEIALVGKDGSQPGESQIGDSAGTFLGYKLVTGGYGYSDNELDYELDANGQKIPVYQKTTDSNLTWGNLINLSDPAYGLDKLELRPAELNDGGNLLKRPLYSVTYGTDGRVEDYFDENYFGYTAYDEKGNAFILVPDGTGYGVRAISSIVYDNVASTSMFSKFTSSAKQMKSRAERTYSAVFAENSPYVGTLSSLVESYADLEISGKDSSTLDCTSYLKDLKGMAEEIRKAYDLLGQTYCGIAEMQRFIKGTTDIEVTGDQTVEYTDYFYDVDELCAIYSSITAAQLKKLSNASTSEAERNQIITAVKAKLKTALLEVMVEDYVDNNITRVYADAKGTLDQETLDAIAAVRATISAENEAALTAKSEELMAAFVEDGLQFTSDIIAYASDRAKLKQHADYIKSLTTAMWSDIDNTVNYLVSPSTCMIGEYRISQLKALVKQDFSAAMDMLNGQTAWIKDGFLKRMDGQLSKDAHLFIPKITIEVTYIISLDVSCAVSTDAKTQTSHDDFNNYRDFSDFEATGGKAQDTYAMALDLWVRTNSSKCFLTLEGEFLRDNAGNILGYVGANRVWDELTPDMYASTNSLYTTQGSGSCYVFSCKAEDYDRTIELLKNFTVAFVNADGDLVARAKLDTENVWANAGRYTVPLVLEERYSQSVDVVIGYTEEIKYYDAEGTEVYRRSDGTYYSVDEDGNEQPAVGEITEKRVDVPVTKTVRYITELAQNEAKWLTTVIYLDGDELTNDQVMAATGIEGKLNIQFGDTAEMFPVKDDTLYEQTITVSAYANKQNMDYEDSDLSAIVNVEVASNVAPNIVEAYFYRQISSQQGVRQDKITFTKEGADSEKSTWRGNYTFDTPGTYRLAYISVDGKEYQLEEPVIITVNGYKLDSVNWSNNPGDTQVNMFSGSSSAAVPVTLSFATDAQTLTGVRGLFISETGEHVSVTFNNVDGVHWVGDARFSKSGTYRLETVYYSGVSPQGVAFKNEEYPVPENEKITMVATLGVTADITLSSDAFANPSLPTFALKNEWAGGADIDVIVVLRDDKGTRLENLGEGKHESYLVLTYASGTGAKTLDTNLTWGDGYYYGVFQQVKMAGIYSFNRVTIGDSLVTNATAAPKLTVISPVPPAYVGNDLHTIKNLSNQLVPGGTAYMAADIASSASAVVRMKVRDTFTGKQATIKGISYAPADGNNEYSDYLLDPNNPESPIVTRWIFELPGDGNWKMMSLEISQFYDTDGTYFDPDPENGQWKVMRENDSSYDVKAVTNIFVNLQYADGSSANTSTILNGQFLDTLTLPGLQLSVADFEGKKIGNGVTAASLTYRINKHGWYELENGTVPNSMVFDGVNVNNENAVFTFGDANNVMVFAYGATYSGTLTFWMNGYSYTITGSDLPEGMQKGQSFMALPQPRVTWAQPSVEITGVNKTDISINTGPNGSNEEADFAAASFKNHFSPNYAYLGFEASWSNGIFGIGKGVSYTAPQLTLKLSNPGLAATTTFTVPLRGGNSSVFTFQKATDPMEADPVTATVGRVNSRTVYGTERGNNTIRTVIMTNDAGRRYIVTLENPIQIVLAENVSTPKLQYVIPSQYASWFEAPGAEIDADYDGKLSVQLPVAGDVGSHTEVEIVTTDLSAIPESSKEYPESQVSYFRTNKHTISEKQGCDTVQVEAWDIYKRTISQTVYHDVVTSQQNVTYGIVGWEIGGKVYKPGDVYPETGWMDGYSGTVIATAVIGEIKRETISTTRATVTVNVVIDVLEKRDEKNFSSYADVATYEYPLDSVHTTAYEYKT